jgi:hypothetical protein
MASSPPNAFFRGYPENLLMSIFDMHTSKLAFERYDGSVSVFLQR